MPRRHSSAFNSVSEPVHSAVLDAWLIANDRDLDISTDRQGKHRWLTAEERLPLAQAEAERAQAEAERSQAEAERDRQARQDIEKRLRELEARLPR